MGVLCSDRLAIAQRGLWSQYPFRVPYSKGLSILPDKLIAPITAFTRLPFEATVAVGWMRCWNCIVPECVDALYTVATMPKTTVTTEDPGEVMNPSKFPDTLTTAGTEPNSPRTIPSRSRDIPALSRFIPEPSLLCSTLLLFFIFMSLSFT